MVGDININPSKREPNSKRYREFMKQHGLVNLIKGYTYHQYNGTSSPVDHFLTNNRDLYNHSRICPYSESDHDVIFTAHKKEKVEPDKVRILARKKKNLNYNMLKADVDSHNWQNVLDAVDVDTAWDTFVSEFNLILDQHSPWKWMSFDDNMPFWVTRELLSCCKQRDALEKNPS